MSSCYLDEAIDILVTLDRLVESAEVFGTLVIPSAEVTFTERFRTYTDAQQIIDQGDSGVDDTSSIYNTLAAVFAQRPHVPEVDVVKVDDTTTGDITDDLAEYLSQTSEWFVMAPEMRTVSELDAIDAWCQTNGKVMAGQTSDSDLVDSGAGSDLATTLKDRSTTGTLFLSWYSDDTVPFAAALAGKVLGWNPDNNSVPFNKQTLAGIPKDPALTQTQYSTAMDRNVAVYHCLKGTPASSDVKEPSGQWSDLIITREWTQLRVTEDMCQILLNANNSGRKIAYTDGDISVFEAALRDFAESGYATEGGAGHFINNSLRVKTPRVADIPDATRQNRQLPMLPAKITPAASVEGLDWDIHITFAE